MASLPAAQVSTALTAAKGNRPVLGADACHGKHGASDLSPQTPSWSSLADQDSGAEILQHPTVAQALCGSAQATLLGGSSGSGNSPWLAVLRPRRLTSRIPAIRKLLPLNGFQLLGDRLLGCNSPEAVAQYLGQLTALLLSAKADFVIMESLEVQGVLWKTLQSIAPSEAIAVVPGRPQPRWYIQLPPDASAYWSRFSRKTRYNLRRAAARLPHTITCYRGESEVALFLERAERISRQSWQGHRFGPRVLNNEETSSFLCSLARAGALRCYTLEQADHSLAFVLGWQWNNRFCYEECAHVTAVASHSPGTVLLCDLLEDLFAHERPQIVDFGFGDGVQKRLFGNLHALHSRVLVFSKRLRPTLVRWQQRIETTCAVLARQSLAQVRLHCHLRRAYRLRNSPC